MLLIGCIVRIYHDAQSSESQICQFQYFFKTILSFEEGGCSLSQHSISYFLFSEMTELCK